MLPQFRPNDRFTVERRAGAGAMGDVFLGTDRETGAEVAIKVLRSGAEAIEVRRFQREIAVLAELRHPAIVQYVDHGQMPDGRHFYAMEWLDGEDLGQRQRHTQIGMRDAVEVIRRTAQAMSAVHARGIVHRDLKLGNIFLLRGKGTQVKLIDFGVVQLPDHDHREERGSIIGTPHFMAPEQARGEPADVRADVYSLGAALFRMLTGRNVFETEHILALLGRLVIEDPPTASSVRFDIPEALDQAIAQAIARKKEDRFENAAELARALARVGSLNNDSPANDRSASAIRRAASKEGSGPKSTTATGQTPVDSEGTRRRLGERRIVAAVVFRPADAEQGTSVVETIREALGADARLEMLVSGEMVGLLGIERSQGDEALRAARAALHLVAGGKASSAVIAVGHTSSSLSQRGNLGGEAFERAARLLGDTASGTVRVDTSVLAAVKGRFVLTEDAHGAVLVREDLGGYGARLLLGKDSPTVGRDKELALLSSLYAELTDEGTPRAALVTGPPGIGKSRVRAELVLRLETSAQPPEVLVVFGDPLSQTSTLSTLGRGLRARIGVHEGEPTSIQVEKVRAYLDRRMPKAVRFLSAFIGELVGVPFPDEGDEPLRSARQSASLMQARLRMALEAFVRAQAERVPQILVLEDAQWADDTTLDLVDWLLGCHDLKFGSFAFARGEIAQRSAPLWSNKNVTRLEIGPLSKAAADKLVARALPEASPSLRSNIVERASGNALFVEELVRTAAQGTDELPLTVQALVQVRLDRVSETAREALRAASVFGTVFWTGGVARLCERDIAADLATLVEAELITQSSSSRIADEEEWTFRQSAVRDAAYASLHDEDLAQFHEAVCDYLESKGDIDVGLLATHAERGRNFARAAELYARATRYAYKNGAHLETALELAERGLKCGAEGDTKAALLLAAAQARIPLGRLEGGVQAAEEAAQIAREGSDMWAEAQRLAAAALIEHGFARDGDARAANALASKASMSSATRIALMAARVRGLVDLGKQRDALKIADEALVLARELNETDSLLRAFDAHLFAVMQLAEPSSVANQGPQVIEIADAAGDLVLATRARINTAASMNLLGLWEAARLHLDRALGDARDRRMRILEAFALHNLGMCEARLGSSERGVQLEQASQDIANETGAARLKVHARVYEGMFRLWRLGLLPASPQAPKTLGNVEADLRSTMQLCNMVWRAVEGVPSLEPTAAFLQAAVDVARERAGANAGSLALTADDAVASSHAAVIKAAATPVEEWEEYAHLLYAEALLRAGQSEACDAAVLQAFQLVAERAARIERAPHRTSYLTRVPEVQALLALAKRRLSRTLPLTHGGSSPVPPAPRKPDTIPVPPGPSPRLAPRLPGPPRVPTPPLPQPPGRGLTPPRPSQPPPPPPPRAVPPPPPSKKGDDE